MGNGFHDTSKNFLNHMEFMGKHIGEKEEKS